MGKLLFKLLYYFQWCAQGWYAISKIVCLYVSQQTDKLIICNAAYVINDMCINHIMYADISPNSSAMQSLFDICYDYGCNNDICKILLYLYVLFLNIFKILF